MLCRHFPDLHLDRRAALGHADHAGPLHRTAGQGVESVFGRGLHVANQARAALRELPVQWQTAEVGATDGDLDPATSGSGGRLGWIAPLGGQEQRCGTERQGLGAYGTTLETHNGRDVRCDALQEAVDLLKYLTQWMIERRDGGRPIAAQTRAMAEVYTLVIDLATELAEGRES